MDKIEQIEQKRKEWKASYKKAMSAGKFHQAHSWHCRVKALDEVLEIIEEPSKKGKERRVLELIERHGGTDELHHKQWLIDQIARILTGDKYNDWVSDMKSGEDWPESYGWDSGIAP